MLRQSGDELYHFGVRGQRKGERRYQYKDGTWTELGKERRRKGNGNTLSLDKEEHKVYNKSYGGLDPDLAKVVVPALVTAAVVAGGYTLNKYLGDPDLPQITADMLSKGFVTKDTTFLSKKPSKEIQDLAKKSGLNFKAKETYVPKDLKDCNLDCRDDDDLSCRNNCGCSSIAYYLRRQGLDVVAKPTPYINNRGRAVGLTEDHLDSIFTGFRTRYNNSEKIYQNSYCGSKPEAYIELLSKKIYKLSPNEDSFGIIGSDGATSHWFAWEKHGDSILLIDPQKGKRIENSHQVIQDLANDGDSWIDCIVRIDDLPINNKNVVKYVQNI